MSKNSLFWGTATGKLGEAVFYRAKGQQRTRAYVENVSNPKTPAQMSNRIQFKQLSFFWEQMGGRLKAAYSNKISSRSDWNEFVSRNKSITPYVPKASDPVFYQLIHAPYILSSGSNINFTDLEVAAVTVPSSGTNFTGISVPQLMLPTGTVQAATTWGQIWTAYVENNAYLKAGDKITVFVRYSFDTIISKQYTVDPENASAFTYVSPALTPDMPTSIGLGATVPFVFVSSALAATSPVSAGVVITRNISGRTESQSNSQMALNAAAFAQYDSYRTGTALNNAIASYGVNDPVYLSTSNPPTNNDITV